MRRLFVLAVLLAPLLGPALPAAAGVDDVRIEAEALALPSGTGNVALQSGASGGRELLIWSGATATGSVTTPRTGSVTIRARGDQCVGAPVLRLRIDGATALETPVATTGWAEHTAQVELAAGTHAVAVTFTNDLLAGCDRNLRVDVVTFTPAPAPEVAPSGVHEAEVLSLPSGTGQVQPDPAASGGRALLIWSTATATGSLTTPVSGAVVVRARGDQCEGAPVLRLSVDGATVLETAVATTAWADHRAPVVLAAGTHTLAIRFTNDHLAGCDRNLRVDTITFIPVTAATAPALAPVLAAPPATVTAPPTTLPPVVGDPFEGRRLHVDPASAAQRQADAWRSSRPVDAALMDRVAAGSTASWIGDWSGDVTQAVDARVGAAARAGALPVLVAYNIPQRDCGNQSAGGAGSPDAYRSWIAGFARGIGDRSAVVILEPDALSLVDCLSAGDQATRLDLLAEAVRVLEARPQVAVYVDAGHSNWVPAAEMARRLTAAGVARAEGFALNVSNFRPTDELVRFARDLSTRVGGKHAVLDTSRNGLGSNGQWCNPSGRALGLSPSASTTDPVIDATLWIKTPGESDGYCNGGPSAGAWWPEYALGLAARANGVTITSVW